ncbi:sugar transferase [Runella sp. SP2]|uniref:sugar transferase n=1 Tax=Runella sp. SP2 TaxID=2268026 RepID=UPI000F096E9C|nr:sugar transferase [Runella sp. SP2]AYQ36453.1 sugar transferase [Runella sp. SP2]
MYPQFFKPLIDKTVAGILLLLTLPITLLVSGLLYFYNDGKPFFFQLRPGLHGQIFRIWKFKTMNDRKNKQGELLPDHERLTAVGKWVRKTSLDELPQLINVLKGDMSLVGPRPLLVEYLPLYNLRQQRRHEVKPGITGWAQINGRNAISWQQKFEYDVWYVENLSFFLDLKILWLTAMKVVKSEGINASQTMTMEKFTGNN